MPLSTKVQTSLICKKTGRNAPSTYRANQFTNNPKLITSYGNSDNHDQTRESTEVIGEKSVPRQANQCFKCPKRVEISDCEMYLKDTLACEDVKKLGTGCYGIGYSLKPSPIIVGEQIATNATPVVVKTFSFGLDRLKYPMYRKRLSIFENEISKYSKNLAHENIVTFLGYFKLFWNEQNQEYFIENTLPYTTVALNRDFLLGGVIIEKMNSTLCNWTKENKISCLDDQLITAVFYQIGGALVYLHEKHSMTHGDLKADNIGLSVIDSKRRVLQLKLLDFGHAKVHDPSKFVAAERHTALFDLDSPECSLKDKDFDHSQLLSEKNAFLDESRKLATMIVRYANVMPFQPSNKLVKDFANVKMQDHRLKRLLGCMVLSKLLNIAQVMNYSFIHYRSTQPPFLVDLAEPRAV